MKLKKPKRYKQEIIHPIEVGTKTNIGVIRSYKYVRFGFGKYRYFVEGCETGKPQEDITEIY